MARTPTFPLHDRILDGRLAELLGEWVTARLSIPDIRDALRDEHEIDVSVSTVRRWLDDLGLETEHQRRRGAAS